MILALTAPTRNDSYDPDRTRVRLATNDGCCSGIGTMDAVEHIAQELAARRLARDLEVARAHGCPFLLKLSAYLPQTRKDAEIVVRFAKDRAAPRR